MLPNARDARELIELYYGIRITTVPRESNVSVGTTALKLGSNANTRTGIAFCNTGAVACAVGFSAGVTTTTGLILSANQFIVYNWRVDGETVNSDIWAISSGAGSTVYVVEYVLSGL